MIERATSLALLYLCSACLLLLAPEVHARATTDAWAPPQRFPAEARPASTATQPKPVIIDTDIGSYIDDSYAIAFALQSSQLDIKLIVTCTDDTVMRARIAAKFLTIAGRDDIPIGIGALNSTNRTNRTLWQWAEDFDLAGYKGGVYSSDETLDMVNDIVSNSAEVVEIIALGPMVNFPYLLQKWPNVTRNSRVRLMAGSIYRGYDNSTTPTAEYNVRLCPSCFNLVLRTNWRYEVSVTPLDTSGVASLTPGDVQELITCGDNLTVGLDEHTLFWCTKGVIPCHLNIATVALPDTVAVLLALQNATSYVDYFSLNLTATEDGHVKIDNNEGASAQVALYWRDDLLGLEEYKKYITSVLVQTHLNKR
jgi:inosine-uridine nucleoside N-ribohydrolase